MNGMEHVIEKVANALHGDQCAEDPDPGERCNCGADDFYRQAEIVLDTLREVGLLAPAPLREEWRIWGEDDDGEWELGRDFESREEAEQFITENPWARDRRGYPVRRPLSDWLPVDRAEGDGRGEP